MQVMCRDENGRFIHERVHRIIASCFVPNPFGYKYVNHKDSNKQNNAVENLEWCTNSDNIKHGWNSGNRTHKNRTHVLVTSEDGYRKEFPSIRCLANELHLDRHKVARILKGEMKNKYQYIFSYI